MHPGDEVEKGIFHHGLGHEMPPNPVEFRGRIRDRRGQRSRKHRDQVVPDDMPGGFVGLIAIERIGPGHAFPPAFDAVGTQFQEQRLPVELNRKTGLKRGDQPQADRHHLDPVDPVDDKGIHRTSS